MLKMSFESKPSHNDASLLFQSSTVLSLTSPRSPLIVENTMLFRFVKLSSHPFEALKLSTFRSLANFSAFSFNNPPVTLIRLAIADYLAKELQSPVFEPPALMRAMVAEGKLGKKSGQGFYAWDKK